MKNVAVTDVLNNRISGGIDIDTAHSNPELQCINVHCWVLSNDGKSVLLQHRSPDMYCYPDKYDISLAGHVDADEEPHEAMLREAREEGMVNLRGRLFVPEGPIYVAEEGAYKTGEKWLHNQLVYVYFAMLDKHDIKARAADEEVGGFEWWDIDTFALRTINPTSQQLVPHPDWYFHMVTKKLYELRRIHAKMSA